METKDIEGTEYILKSEVDELIRGRLGKMSERARTAETKIDSLKAQLEKHSGAAGSLEAMAAQIEALQAEVSESNSKYQTHSVITAHGFTDPDVRDMVDWSYKRSMSGRSKKDRVSLGDWINGIKEDPTGAPANLRPLLSPASTQQSPSAGLVEAPVGAPPGAPPSAPASNAGAVAVPPSLPGRSLMEQAISDPEMWKAKNEEIRAAWYGQRGKPGAFKF